MYSSSQVTSYAQAVTTVPQSLPDVPNPGSNNPAPDQSKKKPWVGGSTTCSLKAASISMSFFLKLGNINPAYSCTNVTDYITTLEVSVTSCFALPRHGKQPPDNINYRICVFTTDAHKLFIKDNWHSGITLQDCNFKPKVTDGSDNRNGGDMTHYNKNMTSVPVIVTPLPIIAVCQPTWTSLSLQFTNQS